jgi:predicted RNase H-like nuclease (RuvC/YqgF family)
MQELKLLCFDVENKVLRLAEAHRQMKADFQALKLKNKELKETIVKLKEEMKIQSEQIVKYKLSGKMNASDDCRENYTDVKSKINELVREIDRCIGLLNN